MPNHAKPQRPKTANERIKAAAERKSIPLLTLEASARRSIADLAACLPPKFTCEDLAREIDFYLDLSGKKIHVLTRTKRRLRIDAMQIGPNFDSKYLRQDWEIIEDQDFKNYGEPFLVDENIGFLDKTIQVIRKRASELGIRWIAAVPVIRKVVDELQPDRRSERVIRGEFCEQLIAELKEIRKRRSEFSTFKELEQIFPNYEVVRILNHSPFDHEDREYLEHPNRWESPLSRSLTSSFSVGSRARNCPHTP